MRSRTITAISGLLLLGLAANASAQGRDEDRYHDRGRESIECRSSGYKFTRCGVNWRHARLVEKLSDSDCVENQSWGIDGEGLWVDQGCAGRFEERRGHRRHRDDEGYDNRRDDDADNDRDYGDDRDNDDRDNDDRDVRPSFQSETMTCESVRGDRKRCIFPRPPGQVELIDQLSDASCVQGETWDWNGYEVWVSDGCRARFRYW